MPYAIQMTCYYGASVSEEDVVAYRKAHGGSVQNAVECLAWETIPVSQRADAATLGMTEYGKAEQYDPPKAEPKVRKGRGSY